MNWTEIPKAKYDDNVSPCWMSCSDTDGNKLKPLIRCQCGRLMGMALHHVHADGTVTESFFHRKGTNFAEGDDPEGCGWHVMLKLKDYDGGDFPPRSK